MPHLDELPYDIYDRILSSDEIGVLEIHALKQTSRALRKSIISLLENYPALYRTKLNILANTIPTGLPKDLSHFTVPQLEAAVLSSFVVERHWRAAQPELCRAPRVYHTDIESVHSRYIPKVTALKVLPGGRWIITGSEPGCISVWDTLTERLVVQCEDCEGVGWIEVDITDNGNILLAVVVGANSEPDPRDTLLVYSLTLDPPPTARDDTLLSLLGCAASPYEIQNPTIKGSIACGTCTADEYCILVYDWQKNAAKILQIGSIATVFESAPSLIILPYHILLYQRHRPSPVIAVFEIPELDPLPEEDKTQPPPCITTPPVYLQPLIESDPEFGQDDFLSSVVEDPSSSSSAICLAALAIQAGHHPQPTLDKPRIYFDLFRTTTDLHLNTLSVPLCDPLRRAVRVYPSTATAGSIFEGVSWRPLMAMGRTGKRAVWVEESLEAGRGGLVGFTAPPPPYADDPVETAFANDLRDPAYERTEEEQQTRENFEGESPLRRLKSTALYTFADVTALGFDEATATVAVGDAWGRVWVLNYGPRSLKVW